MYSRLLQDGVDILTVELWYHYRKYEPDSVFVRGKEYHYQQACDDVRSATVIREKHPVRQKRCPQILTIKKICDGLDITLAEFFSTPEFDALEQEIKWI